MTKSNHKKVKNKKLSNHEKCESVFEDIRNKTKLQSDYDILNVLYFKILQVKKIKITRKNFK